MKTNTDTIYLPIRSFGDFIISAAVVKDKILEKKIPVILPDYLGDIYHAIDGNKYFEIIDHISYSNQPTFFELYKVKDFKNFLRLIRDVKTIKSSLNRKITYLMDYSSKRLSFTGVSFVWPSTTENIYLAKSKLFTQCFQLKNSDALLSIPFVPVTKGSKILIIPESRVKAKNIQPSLISVIKDYFSDIEIDTAFFSNTVSGSNNKCYKSFEQLIQLMGDYDLIISAESLPYHLANFIGKAHFVIYTQSRHFKETFMTPFMVDNQGFTIYNGKNEDSVITDISAFFGIYK
jgi:hypothetical protein